MALEKLRLDDQVAIITGSGRGVGKGIALAFAEAGAHVVCSARTLEQIEATAEQVRERGSRALVVPCDVLQRDQMANLVDRTMKEFGRVDILVNNAGGNVFNAFLDISDEEFSYHFDWNTKSAFILSQLVVPHMLKAGSGVILNISSGMGHLTARGMLSYAVAKAGFEHLTRNLGEELAPKIRVNALALGAIMTSGLRSMLKTDPSFRDKLIEKTPLRRIAGTDEIGAAAVFLCSPAAAFVTSTILHIDGGIQATNLPFRLPDL